jgi:hypothetical protein
VPPRIGARRGRRVGPVAAALLASAAAACVKPALIPLVDRTPLQPEATLLDFSGSRVGAFIGPDGRSCDRSAGQARSGLIGWQSSTDDPVCFQDTQLSLRPARLELRWSGTVPRDGRYELQSRRLPAGAWGVVICRSSYYGEFYAEARIELQASSPSCAATWTHPVASAKAVGPWNRPAPFAGWLLLPDLALEHCREGERLEVSLRLVAEMNRGRVEVDAFGISATASDEVGQAFALRPLPPAPPAGP